MFFGRDFELSELNRQYKSNRFEFPVIYGRRRVGKTELIKEFITDKKAIYIQGIIGKQKQNLDNLALAVYEFKHQKLPLQISYETVEAAFEDITHLMENEKIIFIIDEFPYLAESIPSVSSVLQMYIDQKWKNLNSMLILCGSSMSFIEKQVLSYESPLYGRNMTRYKLLPFTFRECCDFLSGTPRKDVLTYYAITNGIPYYLSMVEERLDLMGNLNQLFLQRNSKLLEEPMNLLNMEVKEPSSYFAVLTAITDGASKHNEIATKAGFSTALTSSILENLMELEIIEKKLPILSQTSKGIYTIKDSLFRFWFTFIGKNINFIHTSRTKMVEQVITERLSGFLGPIFEEICREWLLDEAEIGNLGIFITAIGSWWGGNPKTKKQEEIDIVATTTHADKLFIGECKWQEKPIGIKVVETLIERATLFPHSNKQLFIFAKAHFSKRAIERAKEKNIQLITFKEMYGTNMKDPYNQKQSKTVDN